MVAPVLIAGRSTCPCHGSANRSRNLRQFRSKSTAKDSRHKHKRHERCSGVCASFVACCGCVGVRSACSSCYGHISFTSGRMAVIKVSRTHENGSPRGPAEQEQHTQGQAPDVVGRATGTPRLYMHCLHHSRGPSMSSQCLLLDNRSACMSIAQRLSSVCLRVLPLACVRSLADCITVPSMAD